jgi:phage minor structural protein
MADLRLILADRQGDMVRDVAPLLSCRRTEALDGTDSIDFTTCGVDVSKGQRLFFRDGMGRWHEYVVGTVTEGHDDGGETTVDVWAESAMAHDFRLSYVEDRRPSSLASALAALEDVTRWRVGVVDVPSTDTATWYMYHLDAWSALGKIVERYGGEPSARVVPTGDVPDGDGWTRYVDYQAHRGGATAARRFEWGHDVTSIRREVLDDDVVTAVWAWGKGEEIETGADGVAYGRRIGIEGVTPDGLGYVHDDSLLADWGLPGRAGEPPRHRFAEVVVDDCADASELLAVADARLEEWSVPRVSYDATVAQFGRAGVDFAGVALGDEVQVVDAGFATPIRTTARVVRLVTDELDSSQTKVTLDTWGGDYAADYAALVRSIGSLDGRSAAWDAVKDSAASYLDAQIAALNAMFASSGGYQFTDVETGTTWMDAPTFEQATTAINISGAGFRIADGKTAQGEWDWRTFGTGAGFTADDIVAGIIRSADGKSWWNLTTGEMRIGVGIVIGADGSSRISVDSDSVDVLDGYGNAVASLGEQTTIGLGSRIGLDGDGMTLWGGAAGPSVAYLGYWEDRTGANGPHFRLGDFAYPTPQDYVPGNSYDVGALVMHDGLPWVCISERAYSSATWNQAYWARYMGPTSFAVGYRSMAAGQYSTAEGYGSLAGGTAAHAEGRSMAIGQYSHAEGQGYATATGSHAEGNASAKGAASHAEGGAEASGASSHAEGDAKATGEYAHAEGKFLNLQTGGVASGYASHAEGSSFASGQYAHAEGVRSRATGECSHAEGFYSIASGKCSSAMGTSSAAGDYQVTMGRANVVDQADAYAVIVGNGTLDDGGFVTARSNAATLDWGGNLELAGTATLGTPLPIASGGTGASAEAGAPWLQKSGGTLSGNLVLEGADVYADTANATSGTAPSGNVSGKGVIFRDAANATVGIVRPIFYANGTEVVLLDSRRTIGGTTYKNDVEFGTRSDGSSYVAFTDAGAWRSALGAFATSGGTLNGSVTLKNDVIDRDGANPSSTQVGRSIVFNDKDNERVGVVRADRQVDGKTTLHVAAITENTSGSGEVGTWVDLEAYRNGTRTVLSSDLRLRLRSTNLDVADGVTADTFGSARLEFFDTDSRCFSYISGRLDTSGRTGVSVAAQRANTSGTNVANVLTLYVNSEGKRIVGVSEAKPWRDAIGAEPTQNVSTGNATMDSTYVESGGIVFRKAGHVVQAIAQGVKLKVALTARTTIGTIPDGYRPLGQSFMTINGRASPYVIFSGSTIMLDAVAAGTGIWGSACYMVG